MIRWSGIEILETLDELVDPKHTVLLMWDFAKGVVLNRYNSDNMIRNSAKLLQAARKNNVLTLYARQNDMRIMGDTGAPTIRMRMKRQNKTVADLANYRPSGGATKGSPGAELVGKVKPRKNEIVFEKFLPNAFLGTCFEWWLQKYNIKTIVLAGVNVATGINGTAQHAINLGYYSVVARDCVGTGSREDYMTAIAYMERILDIVDSSEIIKVWNKRTR